VLRQAGVDPEFGDSLPGVFQRAGLAHPGFAAVRIGGDADSLLPEYLTQTMRSLAPLAIAAGAATAEEIAQYTAETLAAQARERQAMLYPQELACAWARRSKASPICWVMSAESQDTHSSTCHGG
jgi:hypothetical protein